MEDMARLALVEQDVRDEDILSKIITELLHQINRILECPNDEELRLIKSDVLIDALKSQELVKYLTFVGFRLVNNEYSYPKDQGLSNLRVAQASLQRKLYFCKGHSPGKKMKKNPIPKPPRVQYKPVFLKTSNEFLKKVENLFNNMIQYEDEELQDLARSHVPLMELQLKAVDRVREYQRMLKMKEVTGHDLPFDIALLIELVLWFKSKFFSWVDKPLCAKCNKQTVYSHSTTMPAVRENCNVEIYVCLQCNEATKFPRYNDPQTLLQWRRGRCGEWANCFTLLCRSLNYDTRYVYDTTDHVWCEVFDYDCNRWLHVDPCEAKIDAPLMYSHGWHKQLSYVIAASRDDLQDVTWRYTSDHKQVLKRRNLCTETELITGILSLREQRQGQVTEMRRQYLAKRSLQELVHLMVEKKPTDDEADGRISGSTDWKLERGEMGLKNNYTFKLDQPGNHSFSYFTALDQYVVRGNNEEKHRIEGWQGGVYEIDNIFRKVENDWRQAYLARKNGKIDGKISWKLSVLGDKQYITLLAIRLSSKLYEDGNIKWTITFNGKEKQEVKLGEMCKQFKGLYKEVIITATLSGGKGDVSWQHAQLFRQSLDTPTNSMFDIDADVKIIENQ